MNFMIVQPLSLLMMSISMLAAFWIPAGIFLFLKKRYGAKKIPFFTGCGTFFVFAICLEGLINSIVLKGSCGDLIMANSLVYSLYVGLMAGIFEETGRFVACKFVLKRYHDDDYTALSYAAGHGGFEAFYILFSAMITNIVLSVMINTGSTDLLLKGLDEDKAAQITRTLFNLGSSSPVLYLIAVVERLSAIAFHMAASVLIWIAEKNVKHWYFILVAIVLHTLLDMMAAFSMSKGLSVALIEIITALYAILCCIFAVKMWKTHIKITRTK